MASRGLLRSASIYTLSNIVTAAIPFLLMPILTRVLSSADYGRVAMFGIVVSILSAFTGLNVHAALDVRYFAQDKFNCPQYVASCLLILLLSTFIVLACTFTFGLSLEKLSSVPADWLLVAVMVSSMQVVIAMRLSVWRVTKQAWKYGSLQISQSALNAGLSLWLVLVVGLSWEGRTLAILLATLIFMVIAAVSLWRRSLIRFPVSFEYMKDALKFGAPLIPHVLGGIMIASIDRIMVTNMLGVTQTGIYTVSLQIGMVLSLVTMAINQAYAPWLFERLRSKAKRNEFQIVRYTYVYFIALIMVAVMIGITAPYILSVLVGEAFRSASGNVIYIAIGFAFGGMYFMVTNYVFFAGATGRLAIVTVTSGVANVIICYALISKFGLAGAGCGFMISQSILFFGTWYLAHHVWPMPWKKALKLC